MTRSSLVLAVLVLAPACASAQTMSARSFRALTTSVAQVEMASVRELTIQWTTTSAGAPAAGVQGKPADAFALIRQRTSNGGLRRERQPELSADQIVVVVHNSAGRELDWRLTPNTRIVRAEVPGPDGRLAGQVMERSTGELLVTIPDVPGADRVRLYRPVWNGKEYALEPLAEVMIGAGR